MSSGVLFFGPLMVGAIAAWLGPQLVRPHSSGPLHRAALGTNYVLAAITAFSFNLLSVYYMEGLRLQHHTLLNAAPWMINPLISAVGLTASSYLRARGKALLGSVALLAWAWYPLAVLALWAAL